MSAQRPRPRPVIYLPIFDARSALSTINVLDAIITAIWAAHGDAIVELQCGPSTPMPPARPADPDEPF